MSALAAEVRALLEGPPVAEPAHPVAPGSPQGTPANYSMALNGDPLLSALKSAIGAR